MPPDEKRFVYVLVRADLPLADQAVQACHAALEAGFAFNAPERTATLVLLSLPDKRALMALSRRLKRAGIDHSLFYEPDDQMGHTALASRPVVAAERHHFGNYELWSGFPQVSIY